MKTQKDLIDTWKSNDDLVTPELMDEWGNNKEKKRVIQEVMHDDLNSESLT